MIVLQRAYDFNPTSLKAAQFSAAGPLIGDGLLKQRPKLGAVIKLFKVAELMRHDIVLQLLWQEKNFIVEV